MLECLPVNLAISTEYTWVEQLKNLMFECYRRPSLYVIHVMNSTCIHHEGSRPEYIHVQVLGNMHKTPYTMGKLQDTHIHLTIHSIFSFRFYQMKIKDHCMIIPEKKGSMVIPFMEILVHMGYTIFFSNK